MILKMNTKKRLFFLGFLLFFTMNFSAFAQKKLTKETDAQKAKRLEWWQKDRFGMFIHWGLYSVAGRHEWVKTFERMSNKTYQKYFDRFNPDLYNPHSWAKMAKKAGMKYAVITTKHHEGFCLFDSKYTDYKSTNTAYGKDLIREWVDAFRAEGLKIGFYYSLIDWHHPDYTLDVYHPDRPNSDKEYDKLNKKRKMSKYRKYLHNQIREILTNYGKIDLLWLDFSFPEKHGKSNEDWDSKKILKLVRKLQPQIILNDRLDLGKYDDGADYVSPEQSKVSKWPERNGKKAYWETCQTFSGSWGYHRDENTWKSPRQLLKLLIETVSKGGNLLLNVGPTGRGNFDYRAKNRLKNIGKWMYYNSPSIYGCTQAPKEFKAAENTILTYNKEKNRLYIHLLAYPIFGELRLENFDAKIKYAQFLHDASEIKVSKSNTGAHGKEKLGKNDVLLKIPVLKPNTKIPVIELFLK